MNHDNLSSPPEDCEPDGCAECECDPCVCPLCPGCGEHVEQSACEGCDVCAKCAPDLGQHHHTCASLRRPLLHIADINVIRSALAMAVAYGVFAFIKVGDPLENVRRDMRVLRRLIDEQYCDDFSRAASRRRDARQIRMTLRRLCMQLPPLNESDTP